MIEFRQVRKAFGTQTVLENASFTVFPGERVGLVGPNGAGKSTVAALLTGELSTDKGEVILPRQLRLGILRQQMDLREEHGTLLEFAEDALPDLRRIETELLALEAGLDELDVVARESALKRLGVLQTEFEHLGGYDLRHRVKAMLCGLGFAPDACARPFRSFSGGWRMRAELVRALVARPDVLVLDEPTNFLDTPAVEWLRDCLRDFPGTLLLIAHDRYLLNSLTNVTLEVAGGRITRYPGNYDAYLDARRQRHDQLVATHANQERERERLERFIERFRATSSKASQVQSRVKQLDKIERVVVPEDAVRGPRIRLAPPPHCGLEVARLEDAGLTYDGRTWVWRHAGLRLERGAKAAIIGYNGMGKTTLLRVLAGALPLTEGRCTLGHQVMPGYFSQDHLETLDPGRTVYATIRAAAPSEMGEKEIRNLLGGFRFSGEATEKPAGVLSGGEKSRLVLCRLLVNPPNFLLLDEPTSHLDIASREMLEAALREFTGTLFLVSHDVMFVRAIADTIFAVEDGALVRYHGDYAYYRARRAAALHAAAAESAGREVQDGSADKGGGERRSRKREEAQQRQELYRRRQPLDARITAAEHAVDTLHAEQQQILEQLGGPAAGLDFAVLNRRLSEIQAAEAAATADWETAALGLEQLLEEMETDVAP